VKIKNFKLSFFVTQKVMLNPEINLLKNKAGDYGKFNAYVYYQNQVNYKGGGSAG
jgi:hypothetical protein